MVIQGRIIVTFGELLVLGESMKDPSARTIIYIDLDSGLIWAFIYVKTQISACSCI